MTMMIIVKYRRRLNLCPNILRTLTVLLFDIVIIQVKYENETRYIPTITLNKLWMDVQLTDKQGASG